MLTPVAPLQFSKTEPESPHYADFAEKMANSYQSLQEKSET